jgi:hypothetical protein
MSRSQSHIKVELRRKTAATLLNMRHGKVDTYDLVIQELLEWKNKK